MFDIYENIVPRSENLTVFHICSSHFISTVNKKIKKCFPDKDKQQNERKLFLQCVSEMIHSRSINESKKWFVKIIMLYGFEYEPEDFERLLKMSEGDKDKGNDSHISVDDEDEEKPLEPAKEDNIERKKSSKYYIEFSMIKEEIEKSTELTIKKNKFYSTEIINYLIDFIMLYFPLWSATCICAFNLKRDSNAPVENYFKIYKHILLQGKKHILAPRFIMLFQKYNDARLTERLHDLTTTRTKGKRKRTI